MSLRLLWWGGTAIGAIGAAMVVVGLRGSTPGDLLGLLAADPIHPYVGSELGAPGAYLYSPAILQVTLPFREASGFVDAWRGIQAAVLVVLAGPFTMPVLLTDQGFRELRQANVDIMLGAAIVAGFRWPVTWAFVLLTKVTPGIALVWFAVRREWRALALAIGATALVVVTSGVLQPAAWADWVTLLVDQGGRTLHPNTEVVLPWPLALRVASAAALVAWGAAHDRRWTVLVAAFLALPATWPTALTILVGLLFPPLWRRPWVSRAPSAPSSADPI